MAICECGTTYDGRKHKSPRCPSCEKKYQKEMEEKRKQDLERSIELEEFIETLINDEILDKVTERVTHANAFQNLEASITYHVLQFSPYTDGAGQRVDIEQLIDDYEDIADNINTAHKKLLYAIKRRVSEYLRSITMYKTYDSFMVKKEDISMKEANELRYLQKRMNISGVTNAFIGFVPHRRTIESVIQDPTVIQWNKKE